MKQFRILCFCRVTRSKKGRCNIDYDKNKLCVRGSKTKKIEEDEAKAFLRMFVWRFEKTIEFSEEVEEEKVCAEMNWFIENYIT
jgi:HSP20 family molecular chaperone IbpA